MRTIITSLFFMLILTLSTSAQTSEDVDLSLPKENMTIIDFFTVTCNEKLWDIRWKAINEIESCTYSIEYSYDQQTWFTFKNINGTAYTSGVYEYNTTMARTSDSLCSFRLKYDCTPSLEYYKNPVANICPDYIPESISTTFIMEYKDNAIQIGGNLNPNIPSKVAVYSILGQLLYQTEAVSVNSKLNIPYQLRDNEIVIVKISNGNNVFSKKIYIP